MPLPPLRERSRFDVADSTSRYDALVEHLTTYGAIDHLALPEAPTAIWEIFNEYKDCKAEDLHVLGTDIDTAKSDIAIMETIAAEMPDLQSQLEYKKQTKTKIETLKLKIHILQYIFQTINPGYKPEIAYRTSDDHHSRE